MRASSLLSSVATSISGDSSGGGGRSSNGSARAEALGAVLLLDAYQRGGQLGGIVAVRVDRIDQVLLDDRDRHPLETADIDQHRLAEPTLRAPPPPAVGGADEDEKTLPPA